MNSPHKLPFNLGTDMKSLWKLHYSTDNFILNLLVYAVNRIFIGKDIIKENIISQVTKLISLFQKVCMTPEYNILLIDSSFFEKFYVE